MALLAAHAACEAMLGLIVGTRPYTQGAKADPSFRQILEDATAVSRPQLATALVGDLDLLHRARNGFVHAGQTVHGMEVERAVETAHSLADHVPAPGSRRLVGPATVVADIIEIEAIGMWLRHADEMRKGGRLRLAADGLARALDEAFDRTVPELPTRRGHWSSQVSRSLEGVGMPWVVARDVAERIEASESLSGWLVPLAIGIPPATYRWLRALIGVTARESIRGHPQRIVDRPPEDPPLPDLRRAAAVVSQVVLRLWMMGGLEEKHWDAEIVQRAQPFLRAPGGYAAGEPGGMVVDEPTS
jgi:hypothetical protein